jgi:diacylglycerol diphosphate phosphatase/phosphatidate phosphatase
VVVVLIIAFLSLDRIEPFHQQFSLRDYTLQYTFAVKERVPNMLLVAVACLAPAIFIVFYTLVIDGIFSHKVNGSKRKYTMKERLWELNCGLLGLALAISMQYVMVGPYHPLRLPTLSPLAWGESSLIEFIGSLKNAIGKPRPDLIDRCQPNPGTEDPKPFGLSNITICTRHVGDPILKDGFRSFPSGHSSSKFRKILKPFFKNL